MVEEVMAESIDSVETLPASGDNGSIPQSSSRDDVILQPAVNSAPPPTTATKVIRLIK